MSWSTRYGEAVARVLAAYPPGPGLVTAIETLIQTAENNAKVAAKDEIAQSVCEGLHDGVGAGLKCLKCYNAEHHFNEEAVVQAEIETGKESPATDPDGEV